MGQRSVYDPHDPWAFRNTWTGEIRNSYDDLWIWVTLVVGLTVLALCVLVPILIHLYCKDFCYCLKWCRCFDRFLSVCYTTAWEQRQRSRGRRYRKSQETTFEEKYVTSSRSDAESDSLPGYVCPPTVHRSYPEGFYPRSVTLPPSLKQKRTRFRSLDKEPTVPRLKLSKVKHS